MSKCPLFFPSDLTGEFFKNLFIFNWRIIALQYVLVSAIYQHESAIGIHIPSFLPPPHLTPLSCHRELGLSSLSHIANYTGYLFYIFIVQWLSSFWLFATPWTAACRAPLSFTIPPELAQTHVHWASDAIQPSHLLSSPSPPALNLSQHQSFSQCLLHMVICMFQC